MGLKTDGTEFRPRLRGVIMLTSGLKRKQVADDLRCGDVDAETNDHFASKTRKCVEKRIWAATRMTGFGARFASSRRSGTSKKRQTAVLREPKAVSLGSSKNTGIAVSGRALCQVMDVSMGVGLRAFAVVQPVAG